MFLVRAISKAPPPSLRPIFNRTFAWSRHPDRTERSRLRPRSEPRRRVLARSPQDSEKTDQDDPQISNSEVWQEASVRPIRNAGDSLRYLLQNDHLVVTRQIEMLNIFAGFEQANRYAINDIEGQPMGYIVEEHRGILSMFSRQLFRTHRPFNAVVMDLEGEPILWIRRPFAWINSRMYVQRSLIDDTRGVGLQELEQAPTLDTFGEVQQRWHMWRRRYDLFLRQDQETIVSSVTEKQPEPSQEEFNQVAIVDEGLFAWDFTLLNGQGQELASISRSFRGFGRELFTDTGQYGIRFGRENPEETSVSLTLEERALTLALAVNIDVDYFSRHSSGHHMGMGWGLFGDWGE
ncbi:Scramblase-domain-containing protein [Sistotremastrum niveocremeum HHB9708]|uniref:Phospholipid scramblase n=1 Tax=Sistotremastrum niveocremeum HHB9708 TaxID=1314777 RepID=A0A165AJZ4_9AGAM|nr:Scramblase-domain-containing protein [Sistotremastrum niveocremeum HHB9708]